MNQRTSPRSWLPLVLLLAATGGCTGVVSPRTSLQRNSLPARTLSKRFAGPTKAGLVPIDLTQLRARVPVEHLIGSRDVLGVAVEGVLDYETNLVHATYPLSDTETPLQSPAIGQPIEVRSSGILSLPMIDSVDVEGRTLEEAAEIIQKAYLEKGILQAGRDRVTVNLIRPRDVHVVVVREDTGPSSPSITRRDTYVVARRGTGHSIDLPIYENDVLHALAETGGLPGIDGRNEVWVLRNDSMSAAEQTQLMQAIESQNSVSDVFVTHDSPHLIKIPLRVCPGQPLPFTPQDVVLRDGDVVFVAALEDQFFMGGGLLNGGRYPLPRDRDVDILEAIAIANNATAGPAGLNAAGNNFRSGPGNIVPPSRVIIVRKLPTGDQIKIHVDLKIAMNEPRERAIIQSGDLVMLKYTASELAANIALNFVQFNYVIPN